MSMRAERLSDPDIACDDGVERGERKARDVRAGRGPRSAARRSFLSASPCSVSTARCATFSGHEHAHLVEHLVPDAPSRNGALCLSAVAMADSSAPSLFTIAMLRPCEQLGGFTTSVRDASVLARCSKRAVRKCSEQTPS